MRLPYRLKSGSWQPSRLRWIDHALMVAVLIVIANIRGLDFLLGEDTWGAKDFMLAAAPAWVWGGVGFLAGASILAYGVLSKRHLAVFVGHGWLASAYAVNSLALALAPGPKWGVAPIVAGVALVVATGWVALRLSEAGRGALAFVLITALVGLVAAAMAYIHPFNGVRGAGAVGFVAMLHFIYMIRTGGRPLRVDKGHASERIVDGGAE